MLLKNLRLPSVLIASRVAGALCGMVASVVMARTLGAEQFGLVAQALSLVMVLSLLCTLSIESGSARFMITYITQNRFGAVWSFMCFNLWMLTGLGALVVISGLIYFSSGNALAQSHSFWAVLAAPMVALTRIFAGFGMGFSEVATAVIPRSFLRQFLFLVGVIILATFATGYAPYQALIAFVIANALVALCQWVLLYPSIQQVRKEARYELRSMQAWPNWVGVGCVIGGGLIFIEFYQFLTILLASWFLTLTQVGQLDICLKLAGFVIFALVAVQQSFTPRNVSAFAKGDLQQLQANLNQAALLRTLIGGVAVLGMSVLGGVALGLFGPDFAQARTTLFICLGIPIINIVFGAGGNLLSLIKRPIILARISVLTVLILILGVCVGAMSFGINGAAMGAVTAWMVWSMCGAFYAHKQIGVDTTLWAIAPMNYKKA